MKVKKLIEELQKMPQEANVCHIWDGAARSDIEVVYIAQSGEVATADFAQVVYDDADRPVNAPKEKDVMMWRTASE